MKIAEIRAKNQEELKDMVLGLKKEQFNLRFQASTGALENKSRFSEVRKTIARIKTVMNESEGQKSVAKKETKKAVVKKGKKG